MLKHIGTMLERHRNTFLITLVTATFLIGILTSKDRHIDAQIVDIPVLAASSEVLSPIEAYRRQRDTDSLRDLAALETLITQHELDEEVRMQAADQLQQVVAQRQAQSAVEGALLNSSLSPCALVISSGSATLVTSKPAITQDDMALVLELCVVHAGIAPEQVRIITAE